MAPSLAPSPERRSTVHGRAALVEDRLQTPECIHTWPRTSLLQDLLLKESQ